MMLTEATNQSTRANALFDVLLTDLQRLDLMIQRQVLRLRATHRLVENDYRGLYIPDEHVDALLRQASPNGQQPNIRELTVEIERLRRAAESRPDKGEQTWRQLRHAFNLSALEMEWVLIALAPAIDLRYETLYAYVQNDVARKAPTVDLALKLLYDAPTERLRHRLPVDSPLHRWHLLRLVPDAQDPAPSELSHYLTVMPRIVQFLLGEQAVAPVLKPFTALHHVPAATQLPIPAQSVAAATSFLAAATQARIVFCQGPPGSGRQQAAAVIAAGLGRPLLAADLRELLAAFPAPAEGVALLQREACLQQALLYLHPFDELASRPRQASQLWMELAEFGQPCIIGSGEPWQQVADWPALPHATLKLALPDYPERTTLWQGALQPYPLAPDADVAVVASRFRHGARQIQDAARYAASLAAMRPEGSRQVRTADLTAAARARSNQSLQSLAQKLEPRHGWDDIVLPPANRQQLWEVYLSVQHRPQVYGRWGFERKLAYGKGIHALFFGPSGTGKTMAAGILAHELGLDLYKIDLATVVSKYIGETEKNLSRIFEAAHASNAILFFDEADALFGKRSEVKDARDRYANIEVAYLLQEMEAYDGIAIMATNLRGNVDQAFARRLHHTVEFPFPDVRQRRRIWERIFPPETPLHADVDFPFLAKQFELSGGNIRNVALAAAFLAAEEGGVVQMKHLVLGVVRELQKMNRLPAPAAFGDYYGLVWGQTEHG